MKILKSVAFLTLVASTALGTAEAASHKGATAEPEVTKEVREKLERLTYYGVFDLLTYSVADNGLVELGGFVFNDTLKEEAEKAVLKVPGVTQVVNHIEDLHWGVLDDEIRAKVYLTIYRDTVLSRYGTATDMALASGVRVGPRGRFGVFGPLGIGNPYFPGFNPNGDYAIHILVSHGEVILVGTVDSEGDKNLAGIKARGVFPVKKVFNELSVKGEKPKQDAPPPPPAKRGFIADAAAM